MEVSHDIGDNTDTWLGYAAFMAVLYSFLIFAEVLGWPSLIEPFLVAVAALVVARTAWHALAIIMFAYVCMNLLGAIAFILIDLSDKGFTGQAIIEALHPAHRLKEIAELVVIKAAWGNVEATRVIKAAAAVRGAGSAGSQPDRG